MSSNFDIGPINEGIAGRLRWLFCRSMRIFGPPPKHVAYIMDGNRRFARTMGIPCSQGHALGYDAMEKTLEWCLEMGVRTVSVYAFSIENFSRASEEVSALMDLAESKFVKLKEKGVGIIDKYGAKLNILGDIWLLPTPVRKAMATAMQLSNGNTRCTLNICFSYTSRHEMHRSLAILNKGISMGYLKPGDIDPELFSQCLYTESQLKPDVLVRTSGETRLSDFILSQSSFSILHFVDVLWPKFSFFDVCTCVMVYQRNIKLLEKRRKERKEFDYIQRLKKDLRIVLKDKNITMSSEIELGVSRVLKTEEKVTSDSTPTKSWKRRLATWISASLVVPALSANSSQPANSSSMLTLLATSLTLSFVFALLFLPGTTHFLVVKHMVRDVLSPWQLGLARSAWTIVVLILRPVRMVLLRVFQFVLSFVLPPFTPSSVAAATTVSLTKNESPHPIGAVQSPNEALIEEITMNLLELRAQRSERVEKFMTKLRQDYDSDISMAAS